MRDPHSRHGIFIQKQSLEQNFDGLRDYFALQTARPKDFPVHCTHESMNTKEELRRDVTNRQHVAGRTRGLGVVLCVRGGEEGQETGPL